MPGFPLLKEWAYAGIFFTWTSAVVSHLSRGDGPVSWGPPLMFLAISLVTLPAAEDITSEWPAARGWGDEQQP